MKKLHQAFVVVAAGAAALALVAGASGTTSRGARIRHFNQPIEALAIDGSRVAIDLGARYVPHATNKVVVWNLRTGRTTTVSGRLTRQADGSSTGAGVFQLAIAGTRVAWLVNVGGNLEGDDYLLTSSVLKPKERTLATETRLGDGCPGRESTHCAGRWLGGLAGSGSTLAVNEWTTDSQGSVSAGQLYVLGSSRMQQIANGTGTVQSVSVDTKRVAVLRTDGTIALYSRGGTLLQTVSPSSVEAAALSGSNLVVLAKTHTLEVYDSATGTLRKTLAVHGGPRNLDAQGKVAIYTTGESLHAVNLSSGKDRVVGRLGKTIAAARIGSAGVAYSTGGIAGKGTLAFLPYTRVIAAVS